MSLDSFAEVVGLLKDTPRRGWIFREVEKPESVADHSYGLCLLTMILCPPELDRLKCLEFAVVHDLAEAVTGDYTPGEGLDSQIKYEMEMKAMKEIAAKVNSPRLIELFAEYERRDTPEAVFVKQMDKLDVVLQARYYDMKQRCRYFDRPQRWKSLFEEYEGNARPVLREMLSRL